MEAALAQRAGKGSRQVRRPVGGRVVAETTSRRIHSLGPRRSDPRTEPTDVGIVIETSYAATEIERSETSVVYRNANDFSVLVEASRLKRLEFRRQNALEYKRCQKLRRRGSECHAQCSVAGCD